MVEAEARCNGHRPLTKAVLMKEGAAMAETSVPQEEVKVKRCPKCGETKARPDFPKEKSHSDGLGSYCRVCTNAYAKRFREKYKIKHRGEVSRVGEKSI